MLALRIVVSALAMAAGDQYAPNFEEPAFWNKRYEFEIAYRRMDVTVVAGERGMAQIERVLDAKGAKIGEGRTSGPRGVIAEWLVVSEDPRLIQKAMAAAGTLKDVAVRDSPAPQVPELYYKRRRLEEELRVIADQRKAIPSSLALLDAQMNTLDRYIERLEKALRSTIVTLIVHDAPVEQTWSAARSGRRLKKRELLGAHTPAYWDRKESDAACGTPASVRVEVAVNPGGRAQAREKLARFASGQGPKNVPCALALAEGTYFIQDEYELRRRLASVGRLVRWERSEPQASDGARKYLLLAEELTRNQALLERVPHIHALLKAEVARLKLAFEGEQALRSFSIVQVTFVDADN